MKNSNSSKGKFGMLKIPKRKLFSVNTANSGNGTIRDFKNQQIDADALSNEDHKDEDLEQAAKKITNQTKDNMNKMTNEILHLNHTTTFTFLSRYLFIYIIFLTLVFLLIRRGLNNDNFVNQQQDKNFNQQSIFCDLKKSLTLQKECLNVEKSDYTHIDNNFTLNESMATLGKLQEVTMHFEYKQLQDIVDFFVSSSLSTYLDLKTTIQQMNVDYNTDEQYLVQINGESDVLNTQLSNALHINGKSRKYITQSPNNLDNKAQQMNFKEDLISWELMIHDCDADDGNPQRLKVLYSNPQQNENPNIDCVCGNKLNIDILCFDDKETNTNPSCDLNNYSSINNEIVQFCINSFDFDHKRINKTDIIKFQNETDNVVKINFVHQTQDFRINHPEGSKVCSIGMCTAMDYKTINRVINTESVPKYIISDEWDVELDNSDENMQHTLYSQQGEIFLSESEYRNRLLDFHQLENDNSVFSSYVRSITQGSEQIQMILSQVNETIYDIQYQQVFDDQQGSQGQQQWLQIKFNELWQVWLILGVFILLILQNILLIYTEDTLKSFTSFKYLLDSQLKKSAKANSSKESHESDLSNSLNVHINNFQNGFTKRSGLLPVYLLKIQTSFNKFYSGNKNLDPQTNLRMDVSIVSPDLQNKQLNSDPDDESLVNSESKTSRSRKSSFLSVTSRNKTRNKSSVQITAERDKKIQDNNKEINKKIFSDLNENHFEKFANQLYNISYIYTDSRRATDSDIVKLRTYRNLYQFLLDQRIQYKINRDTTQDISDQFENINNSKWVQIRNYIIKYSVENYLKRIQIVTEQNKFKQKKVTKRRTSDNTRIIEAFTREHLMNKNLDDSETNMDQDFKDDKDSRSDKNGFLNSYNKKIKYQDYSLMNDGNKTIDMIHSIRALQKMKLFKKSLENKNIQEVDDEYKSSFQSNYKTTINNNQNDFNSNIANGNDNFQSVVNEEFDYKKQNFNLKLDNVKIDEEDSENNESLRHDNKNNNILKNLKKGNNNISDRSYRSEKLANPDNFDSDKEDDELFKTSRNNFDDNFNNELNRKTASFTNTRKTVNDNLIYDDSEIDENDKNRQAHENNRRSVTKFDF